MRFIQTFYVDSQKDPYKDCFGWFSPEYHLMSWALSCLQLHKLYGSVELYANTAGANLLINELDLPYSSVSTSLDEINLVDTNLWALPKIYTYSLQQSPFLHLDGDVFLFKKFRDNFLESELIAQNLEQATEYYISTQMELIKHFTYFPDSVKKDFDSDLPIKAVNAGIIGGNNLDFIKEYTSAALKYVNENVENLSKIYSERFNVFFEQHLFYSIARDRNIPIDFLFPDKINDNQYEHLGEFHEVPCLKSYLHLLGHYKKDEFTCIQMAYKLRSLYPQYYYKIIALCKRETIPFSLSLYKSLKLKNLSDYFQFNSLSKEAYIKDECTQEVEYLSEYNKIADRDNFELSVLLKVANSCQVDSDNLIEEELIISDYKLFILKLKECLNSYSQIASAYIYGRDIESTKWYCQLFGKEEEVRNKIISKCDFIQIIESDFDWSGFFNKWRRVGVRYYEDLQLAKGNFYNLVTLEVSGLNFSLYDIDDFEKNILDSLNTPSSIQDILLKMQAFVEDDVIQNHLDVFENLVITLLKQLVIKKAVKPF